VSIGKRFVNLMRANINSLLERTGEWESSRSGVRIEDLSDAELETELARRRRRRRAAEEAAANPDRDVERDAWREVEDSLRGNSRYRTTGRQRRVSRGYERVHRRRGAAGGQDQRLARLYAQLECPYGADINTVRKQYRALMRKYHPDMHSGTADKQRLATELSQRLTTAYNELRRALS